MIISNILNDYSAIFCYVRNFNIFIIIIIVDFVEMWITSFFA